ncbi:MAG: hypothetical protein ABJJ37_08800 [Roseibium sp.]
MKKLMIFSLLPILLNCSMRPQDFTNVPRIPESYGVTIASVLFSVECEILGAIKELEKDKTFRERAPFLKTMISEVTFDLNLIREIDINGKPNFFIPFANFNLTGAFGLKNVDTKTIETQVKVLIDLELEPRDECLSPNSEFLLPNRDNADKLEVQRIDGVIGVSDWIFRIATGLSAIEKDPTALMYKAEFKVVRTAEASAKFEAVPTFQDSIGGEAGGKGSGTRTHRISLTTIPRTSPPEKQTVAQARQNPSISQRDQTTILLQQISGRLRD